MEKEEFDIVKQNIISELEKLEHKWIDLGSVGDIPSDISDIGNVIGIAVGKIMSNKENFDKDHFINGFKHGISLTDGTH